MDRKKLLKKYDHKYKTFYPLYKNRCVYCDDIKQCVDHSPALKTVYTLGIDNLMENNIESFKTQNNII